MAFEPQVTIWPGSSSYTTGSTPYGYYDTDAEFISDIDKFAKWAGGRLGYPILNVELVDLNFYSAFEDAVGKYGTLVSLFNARDNMINVSGLPTASMDFTGQYIQPTLSGIIKLSKQYATEAGAGGLLTYYTGSVALREGVQVYDFKDPTAITVERGNINTDSFTIRKVFYDGFPAASVNPLSISSDYNILNEFGWSRTTGETVLMPLNYDIARMQEIEMSNQIRRASYTFQLTNNRLFIFPIPTEDLTLWFNYTLDDDILGNTGSAGAISDISNIPYHNLVYSRINDLGRDWIKRYGLAICKETLGLIRGKLSAIPFSDNNEITLNSADLISQAATEQENLITELKEILESTSKQSQLERKQAEADAISEQLKKVPLSIYIR